MEKVHEAAKALFQLTWWLQRKGPLRVGLEPLPATEVAILGYVEDHEGVGVTEVGTALNMKAPNVSAAVRALVEGVCWKRLPTIMTSEKRGSSSRS